MQRVIFENDSLFNSLASSALLYLLVGPNTEGSRLSTNNPLGKLLASPFSFPEEIPGPFLPDFALLHRQLKCYSVVPC